MAGSSIIVIGVSGCGKSTVGAKLAQTLGAQFIDGDDLHPKANIIKMSRGEPLNDNDRAPWLERIHDAAFSLENNNKKGVIVCSALKKHYRDKIRQGNQHLIFIFLEGPIELIMTRMSARQGHFMKDSMVQSQFNTLERPNPIEEPDVAIVDIDTDIEEVVERCVIALSQWAIGKEERFA